MVLKNINFEINKNGLLKEKEKEILIDAYRELFIKLYGFDMFDSLIKVIASNAKEVYESNEENQHLAVNYSKAVDVIENIKNNDDTELFLVYEDENLIAGGRLQRKDSTSANLLDIALVRERIIDEKTTYKFIIQNAEDYFKKLNYKKMYLEVPLKDIKLLKVVTDLGFVEDPKDIIISPEVYTYIFNKNI